MKLRPIAVVVASAAMFAGTFAGSGLGVATATTTNGARAGAVHRVVHHAATDGLAMAAALRAKIGRPGVRSEASAGLGVITGVVDGAGGRPVTGACVIATGRIAGAMAMTGTDGRYILTSLRPGTYALHYADCSDPGRYLDQWSGGASWPGGAASVTVAASRVKTLAPVTLRAELPSAGSPAGNADAAGLTPAELASAGLTQAQARDMLSPATPSAGTAGGAISGRVTGDGKPVRGICVNVYGPGSYGFARTGKAGNYRAGHLAAGRYEVAFYGAPYCASSSNWLTQWYRGLTTSQPPRKPTLVRVAAGRTTGGIDAALKLGGEIDGTARSKSGRTLSGVCVFAVQAGKIPPRQISLWRIRQLGPRWPLCPARAVPRQVRGRIHARLRQQRELRADMVARLRDAKPRYGNPSRGRQGGQARGRGAAAGRDGFRRGQGSLRR